MKKKCYFLILTLVSISLFGCSNQGEKEQKVKKDINTEQRESSSESEIQKEVEEVTTDEKIISMLDSLNQGFSNFFNIEYVESEKAFTLTAKEDGPMFAQLEKLAQTPNDGETSQKIKEISESLVGFSESVSDSLGSNQKIILKNNFNNLGNFFEMKDGKITYPILKTEG